MDTLDFHVNGTLIGSFYVCKRQVWLIAHSILPDEENPFLELGRLVHETSYDRDKRSIHFDNVKFDILLDGSEKLIVAEIKKSSRCEKSSTMQLAFYLKKLKDVGIVASGELRFPTEKRRQRVELSDELIRELNSACHEISIIARMKIAPEPQRIKYCPPCGYYEFCWV